MTPAPTASASSKWRTRLFTYDSLGRLLTAYNPESGTITYQYDADGNLTAKTDARGITVTYSYDGLHRLTQATFSNGDAPEQFFYDFVSGYASGSSSGRLVKAYKNGGHYFTYDPLGRVTSTWQCLPSDCNAGASVQAQYDLAGELIHLGYPDSTAVNYTFDAAGHMLSAIDRVNTINYASAASYGPDGALTGFLSGANPPGGFAGIANAFIYNQRLQPCRMTASSTGAVPTNCVNSFGNVLDLTYDFHLGAGDNGNVWGITNYRDQTRNQTFTYDPLNRLSTAQNAGTDCTQKMLNANQTKYWGNSYGYDAWGNLRSSQPA